MPQDLETKIAHKEKNVFTVTPPAGVLDMPAQQEAVDGFLKAVSDAAAQHRANHKEGAVMVIDMTNTPSMNSYAANELIEAAARLQGEGHQIVLARTDRFLGRLMNKINREKMPIVVETQSLDNVVQRWIHEPPREEAPDRAAQGVPAAPAISAAPPPPPPPPKPDWKMERIGNAVVITPPQGTRLTEESDGRAFAEKVKELMPDPATLPHGVRSRLILDMGTITALTGDSIGHLMKIPGMVRTHGMDLTVTNLADNHAAPLKSMKIDKMFNISGQPTAAAVEAANQKGGAAAAP